MQLSAGLVPLDALPDRDLDAWRALAGRAIEPNPFFDPDFVLPAARGLGELDRVAILAVRRGQDWQACLPVRRYARWHKLPLPAIATWLHLYCALGTPLVAPEEPEAALAAILERMLGDSPRPFFAALEWVPAEGPVAEALKGAVSARPLAFDSFSRATLHRRPTPGYLDARVKGKHRREFRRMARMLEEELGQPLELVDRAGEETALDAFLELEAAGWKGRDGTALVSKPGHARFFRELAAAFSERGDFELLFLEAGGRAAAARCDLRSSGAGFCFKVAYDERFGRFSPGRELELRRIDRFHEDAELAWMDSCTAADNDLFNRLWPDRRTLVTTVYPAAGPRGRLAAAGVRSAAWARDRRRRAKG